MGYIETTNDPEEGETIPTGVYSVRQYYDDIWMEAPYFSAKFYLNGDYVGFAGTNYTLNYTAYSYNFTIETDYTWRIDIYNDLTDEWNTGTTHNLTVSDAPPVPLDPENPTPIHEATEVTSFTLSWEDGGGADTFDVYFRAFGEFFEKIASDIVDLSVSVEEFLYDSRYNYGELYLWCVIAKNEYGVNYAPPSDFGIGYGGTIWGFNASTFKPPLPTGVTLDYSGDSDDEGFGEPTGTPTGGNAMLTVRRLVAAAYNKIWYEDI